MIFATQIFADDFEKSLRRFVLNPQNIIAQDLMPHELMSHRIMRPG